MPSKDPGDSKMTLGFWVGLVVCLALGTLGMTLQESGSYKTDELNVWLRVIALGYAAMLAAAIVLVVRSQGRVAGGLAIGATLGSVIAPGIVFIDILRHSE